MSSTSLSVLLTSFWNSGQLCLPKFSRVFSSATFDSETASGFRGSFQKASCIALQIWYLQGVQIWRVRWPLFLLNHSQTVRVQILLSDVCCVHRTSYILLNLPLSSAVGFILRQILNHRLTNSFSYSLQKQYRSTKITLQWHRYRVKLVLLFVETSCSRRPTNAPAPLLSLSIWPLLFRTAGESSWSEVAFRLTLKFSMCTATRTSSYSPIEPSVFCVFSLVCFVYSFVLFDLFVCPHSFMFPEQLRSPYSFWR